MIISNYEIGKEIGSGSFGTVNIAQDRGTGEKVAVKCISKSKIQKSNMGCQVKKEITTMKKLDHPNIVRIKEVLMSDTHLYLILEYVGGGELFTRLVRQGKLSENVAKRYFKQVMDAVKFCHNLYICHRDIKPENILLDSNDNVKIADFGFASIMEPEPGSETESESEPALDAYVPMSSINENNNTESGSIEPFADFVPDSTSPPKKKTNKFRQLPSKIMQKMSTMCGTTQYMAPEIVNRDSYRGDKADIWSCGVVLFVLLTGYLPFDSNNPDIVTQKIKNGTFTIPNFISGPARDVLTKLLTANPLVRPSAKTMLQHQWFGGVGPLVRVPDVIPRDERRQSLGRRGSFKLVPAHERKTVLNHGLNTCIENILTILRSNTWMQNSEHSGSIKASKVTSTGLAMIQINVESGTGGDTTAIEVEVFGTQKNSGAREINALIKDIKALDSA